MIYTAMTVKAMRIAYEAHEGQTDHNGVPYILHPVHLAEQMEDEISCTVALLHDVVEDTDVTLEALEKEFPKEVTEAVALLTHDKQSDYFDYIMALKAHPLARKIKLADLAHNSDPSRAMASGIPEEESIGLRKRYEKAVRILTEDEKASAEHKKAIQIPEETTV
ncbi:MAG: bifunctional (p)ppGpp synthetase/guanosine-3',5'-bis(diphosphate) 3'-pyrophosphohydrolase [Lachnospiraceae bacterium]|nr:bifunctional (p)ppGpp synthetase/guanosine-3',5'-bis(diphosphate) 3'-pyrophosphohydrolase [Lachnospiraceae bacterium]